MLWPVIIEWLARLILLLLVGLSIWSMTIIIDRRRYFKALNLVNTEELAQFIAQGKKLQLPVETQDHWSAKLVKLLQDSKEQQSLEYSFSAFKTEQRKKMEVGLSVLGTLGPISPFIGLLGTILGIIVSFAQLSQGGGGTNQVMYSLAEALILTAVGLLVAIPSVIAFNYFNGKSRAVLQEAGRLKDTYLAQNVNLKKSES